MKMVKSLLLGSAAGLAAVAGAQAADLPVKAKAVEYVKVCSLYGAGFFYIPGTDTCLKIGGFVRTEWNHNAGGSFAPTVQRAPALSTPARSDTLVNRTRGLFSFDVRSQTEYGTLRSYIRAGWQWTSNTDTIGGSSTAVYLDRAFIQFAGFTFGKTQSFFDVPDIADMTYQTEYARNNTGGSGTPVFAYTAMLGNGVTATLSIEDYSERRAERRPDVSRAARSCVHRRRRQRRRQPRQRSRRTSSVTCASTRLGALPRSPVRCISTRRRITAFRSTGRPAPRIRMTSGAGPSALASC